MANLHATHVMELLQNGRGFAWRHMMFLLPVVLGGQRLRFRGRRLRWGLEFRYLFLRKI